MSSAVKRKAATQTGPEAKKPKQHLHDTSITSFFSAPKPPPVTSTTSSSAATKTTNNAASAAIVTAAPEPAIKFDKAKWVGGLTDEQRTLLQLEVNTLDESWLAVLKDEIVTKEFLELKRFLERETRAGKKWFPPQEDVYSWSRHTPFPTVKVVILGQDPYHNHNQAHGLAFSVRPPTPAPPSLRNMYKGLANDYPKSFVPPPRTLGSLLPWADRGVLLLNTCLTVRAHEANSHANRGWEKFTQKIIDLINERKKGGVVFMAWGTPAGKRVLKVNASRHLVLKSVHPSPLSASRGFFDCGHFRRANEWLVKRYGPAGEVDWGLTEGCSTLEYRKPGQGEKKVEDEDVPGEKDEEKTEETPQGDDLKKGTPEKTAKEQSGHEKADETTDENKSEEDDEFGGVDKEWEEAALVGLEDAVNKTADVAVKAKTAIQDALKGKETQKTEDDENTEPKSGSDDATEAKA
ncbi:uracil DNA glycosylase [Coniochaeta pulveracea]|uniref:Uracil-DNA glycosylase n=1 Tax=Coniochaeta pulveracea TaxID=177199 RepID=A0A420YKI5_9PEZI|nr:uracil DNA glycosylase [Coniochaeta pulveracea]